MKTRNILSTIVLALAFVFSASLFTSCQSPEEKAISQLETLCETIESDSFNSDDWESIQNQYADLQETIKECDFTEEQLQTIGKLNARFASAAAKQSLKSFGKGINDAINVGKGFIDGLKE